MLCARRLNMAGLLVAIQFRDAGDDKHVKTKGKPSHVRSVGDQAIEFIPQMVCCSERLSAFCTQTCETCNPFLQPLPLFTQGNETCETDTGCVCESNELSCPNPDRLRPASTGFDRLRLRVAGGFSKTSGLRRVWWFLRGLAGGL